jgi:D-alanyl-D-alanine carboxypeptidase (penicillin-binding protein 5/6)
MRLIAVVLGAVNESDRFDSSINLLNYGFQNYETFKLYERNHALTDVRIWKGSANDLSLGFLDNIFITLPRGRYDDMQASLRVSSIIQAPVSKGQSFGNVELTLDEETVATIPLVALDDVAEAGFLGRFSDQALMMINSLFD